MEQARKEKDLKQEGKKEIAKKENQLPEEWVKVVVEDETAEEKVAQIIKMSNKNAKTM